MSFFLPVLEYHDLSKSKTSSRNSHAPYILSDKKFLEQIKWLYENDYHAITFDDVNQKYSEKTVILTFDDGDISNYELVYPILQQFGFVGTFFIIPALLGQVNNCTDQVYMSQDQVLTMSAGGMKIESHSLTHPMFLSLCEEEIIRELIESKKLIEDLIKKEVSHFCLPYGFYNDKIITLVRQTGYRTIVTEDFGYYNPTLSFDIVPRFTIKANITMLKFTGILQRKRIPLINEFMKYKMFAIMKRILGYDRYRKMSLKLSRIIS